MTRLETAVVIFAIGFAVAAGIGVARPFLDWLDGDVKGAYSYVRVAVLSASPFALGLAICVALAHRKK